MLNYQGTIVKIGQTTQVSEKFSKRELILTDGAASYPQFPAFQFTQKNCELLEGFKVGDQVEVTFGIKGREYNGKYFTNLDGFRIKKLSGSAPITSDDDSQDLPF